jgi:hypothetical protein
MTNELVKIESFMDIPLRVLKVENDYVIPDAATKKKEKDEIIEEEKRDYSTRIYSFGNAV